MIITIDGPAGSGKSTVAKLLTKKLDAYYLYTGLFYRAVAYVLINEFGKSIDDLQKVSEKDLDFIKDISYEYDLGEPQIFYGDKNLTKNLYHGSLDQPASVVSAVKVVRKQLLPIQQNVAKKYNIVADGRDCGSVVFPNADYKFYLTAGLETRAKRIWGDVLRNNSDINLDKVKAELEQRDKRDMERSCAPLTIPNNAITIDNSNLSIPETVEEFLRFIKKV